MSATQESSHSSLGTGLAHVLSKARRGKKNGDDSSMISSESDTHNAKRGSVDSTLDKLRGKLGHDDDEDSHGIRKLIPTAIKSRRKHKKKQRQEEANASEEVARGRSIADRGTLENDDGSSGEDDADASSVLTYESEVESAPVIPPPFVSHPSHIGYLTTSSPTVQSTSLPDSRGIQQNSIPIITAEAQPAISSTTTRLESSVSDVNKLQTPNENSKRRSPSPVGRLRDALSTKRGAHTSPERKTPVGAGLGIGVQKDGANDSRRGSVSSRLGAIFPDRSASPSSVPLAPNSPDRERVRRFSHNLNTSLRPVTPPHSEQAAPTIVNTPPTPTEPTITRFSSSSDNGPSSPTTSNPNVVTSPTGNMISHRRVRTNSSAIGPSKLSNIVSAPLTPAIESGPQTTGSNQSTGFFSSVFSAAQNAANSLSTSIANTSLAPNQQRNRSGTQELKNTTEIGDAEGGGEADTAENGEIGEASYKREPAVKTLGMGDLSLSHLGIDEESAPQVPASTINIMETHEQRGRSMSMNRDNLPSPSLVPTATMPDSRDVGAAEDTPSLMRPRSLYEASNAGDQTPPNGSMLEGKSGIARSGSIRSAIGGTRRKRHSSAATGTTIGAAIAAANASVAHPAAQGLQPKLTGFAVASKKRNRDFHQLFRSVPDDDYLIEDYSCALQREILAHGRLYVSEGHLCFSSNIFGWVTTLVMSFDEIVSVEKRSTAVLFKNGLMISTLHAKNVFASFTSRDSTYDLIVGIWKLGHPSLRSSLNGVRIEETGGGDKTEKIDINASHSGSESEEGSDEDDEVYDEDDDDENEDSFVQAEGSVADSEAGERIVSRKPSTAIPAASGNTSPDKGTPITPSPGATDFPGPPTHAPTDCSDHDAHYEKVIADELIAAPLGKVYNLMFGASSAAWMSKWLTGEQKCTDLQMEDKKALTDEHKSRVYSYIKPLNGSIGPRQTKCITTENLDSFDLEKAVSVTMSTQTPDVPSGNVFSTKTKYCLTWGEGGGTRLHVNCAIEWTGKSWLKGPIEKGANDGQLQYAKDITASLKAAVSTRPRGATVTSTTVAKGKRKGRKGTSSANKNGAEKVDSSTSVKKGPKTDSWGIFEPLHGIFGPVVDIFRPLLGSNLLYGLVFGLLIAAVLNYSTGSRRSRHSDVGFLGTPERIAAYEEIWRREESELWEWIEERVGLDTIGSTGTGQQLRGDQAKDIKAKVKDARASEVEMEAAIRVTEEKLRVLKSVVERGKTGKKSTKTATDTMETAS